MGKHPLGVGGEKQEPSIGEAVASIQADECPGLVKQFFVAEVTDGLGQEHAAELLKDRLIDIFGSILTAEGMLAATTIRFLCLSRSRVSWVSGTFCRPLRTHASGLRPGVSQMARSVYGVKINRSGFAAPVGSAQS